VQGVSKLSQAPDPRQAAGEISGCCRPSQTRDKDAATEEGVGRVISELRETYDWILCDSPAASSAARRSAMRYADEAIIVTNPEVSSVRDSDASSACSTPRPSRPKKGERSNKHVLINRYESRPRSRRAARLLSIEDVLEILARLLGIVPGKSGDVAERPPMSARP
jgi:septum site-determining protein MinD